MKTSFDAEHHALLAFSFVNQTAFVAFSEDSLEGTTVAGAATDVPTLYCGNVLPDLWVQVTEQSVRLISPSTCMLLQEWQHPTGKPISTSACNAAQLVVASGLDLFYFRFEIGQLVLVG